jgi:ketohexokinase/beta-glucosidase
MQYQQGNPPQAPWPLPKLSEDRLTGVIDWIRATFDNHCKTVDQIVAELNLPICRETLRKVLKACGMTTRLAAKKLPLDPNTPEGRERRMKHLDWAEYRRDWTYDDWRRIVFTDEAYISSGWHRRPWVHRFPDEIFHPTVVLPQHD